MPVRELLRSKFRFGFNPLLKLLNVSIVNKVFGDLTYDISTSEGLIMRGELFEYGY